MQASFDGPRGRNGRGTGNAGAGPAGVLAGRGTPQILQRTSAGAEAPAPQAPALRTRGQTPDTEAPARRPRDGRSATGFLGVSGAERSPSQGLAPRYQSTGSPRRRFTSPRRFFSSIRRSREATVGRVARRRFGSTSALATSVRTFSRASSRLRPRSRVRWLVTSNRPSASRRFAASRSRRARAAGVRPAIAERSTCSSTREATLLTFWPPGPDDRTARTTQALAGTMTSAVTRMESATTWCPRRERPGPGHSFTWRLMTTSRVYFTGTPPNVAGRYRQRRAA